MTLDPAAGVTRPLRPDDLSCQVRWGAQQGDLHLDLHSDLHMKQASSACLTTCALALATLERPVVRPPQTVLRATTRPPETHLQVYYNM